MKEAIDIESTFTLVFKFQKYVFYQNMTNFLAGIVSLLNPC